MTLVFCCKDIVMYIVLDKEKKIITKSEGGTSPNYQSRFTIHLYSNPNYMYILR